jgi:hypothetical protein
MQPLSPLPDATEVGTLGIYRLKRLWAGMQAQRCGQPFPRTHRDRHLDHIVTDAIGLGFEQVLQYLMQMAPSFEAFECWIVATTGGVAPERVARLNGAVSGAAPSPETQRWLDAIEANEPVLSADDLRFWDEHGYVVVHDAVPEESRAAAAQAVWDYVGGMPDDPESWYRQRRSHGIMLQYFQHPAFEANRRAPRLHKAFAQLWGTADLWTTTDRVGFNVPERPGWRFPGPDLHWDVSLQTPIPFGTQGIVYLTDTEAEQGAFTLVPGFHNEAERWLASLPADANPRVQDLHALGSQPIAGRAGDLIIWHHALPHGSRPNRACRPRLVQYINMRPILVDVQNNWI